MLWSHTYTTITLGFKYIIFHINTRSSDYYFYQQTVVQGLQAPEKESILEVPGYDAVEK